MERGRGLILSLIMVACFHGNTAQRTVCTQEAVADIVFMVDGSWSIGKENFEQIRQFLNTLVSSFDIGPDHVRIGLIQYSNTPRTEFLLSEYQTKQQILQYVDELPYMGGGTMTGQGLEFMLNKHFVAEAGGRASQNVPQIAVVITDGKSQDEVKTQAEDLKRRGIILYAVGIKDADEEQLRDIANEPHSQHVYSVSDFAALQGISQSIIQTLCTTVEEAKRNILQLTQECANATVADIVFLVDSSGSIGDTNFQEVRQFLKRFATSLDIGPDNVRIGLAQYSDDPHQEFLLKDNLDKQSLLTVFETFTYQGGGTETGKAIDFLLQTYFTEEAGSRASQRVPQIAVIITDGESTDDVLPPAQRLRQHGVLVFGIGVGAANLDELASITNRPRNHFLFPIDSYQALQRLSESLLKTVCISMEYRRQALAEKFADIFFLVDSGVSTVEFMQIRNVLVRLVNQLNVGESGHRLGLAQYGQDTKVEFLFNAFETKEEYLAGVRRFRQRRLQPNEPRNLGSALEYANTNFFTSMAGSRVDQGFKQYLVVISGKDSDDSVYKSSRLLKAEGITVVGMTLGASLTEMRVIATQPYIYQFTANIVPLIKPVFETQEEQVTLTDDCKAAKLADIVFIVDESGSIGTPNFQLVRAFLHSIVNGLEVNTNRVRVGIVTYNDKPTAQIYLDSFDDKDDLLNFIKLLPYNGGGTNTGAAINFTRQNVFTEKRGSRKDKGVQQVAVVITDGESQDNVSKAAANLRREGVTVYAVGIKGANEEQLVQIASYPSTKHVYNVESFTKLKALDQGLQKALCQNILHQAVAVNTRRGEIKEGCVQTDEADIYFLIDHSGSIYPADFEDMRKFIIAFIHTFRIGPQYVRIGVAKYADNPNLEFDLTAHSDVQSLVEAVEKIQQKGGGTETGKALAFMGQYFREAQHTRGHKVQEYLVVITDGKSSDMVKVPAEQLRAQGITVYAIGVKDADENELQDIAGDAKRTFFVNNFDALKPIKDDIITDICSKEACTNIPGDLIFLIDSSGSIYPQDYTKMKEFMKAVISKSNIGNKEVHVGVLQFSTDRDLVFRLNRYYSKEEMSTAIDAMQQLGGGTHTGEAITEVSRYFDATEGGRPHLRQRLVVITDGEAQDEVKGPAEALRAKGVLVYAIGVVDANTTQLLEISGSPDRMYAERDFDALKDLESQVALQICDPERECKKTEKADIIFLVDGSTRITSSKFKSIQKFMISIVNQTTVGQNLTRFGVILYSTDFKSDFMLNKYKTRQEVFKAILALKSPTGDTDTAKALQYSLQFFDSEQGGRAKLHVPQILMVITDRDATESLVAPSEALQNKGITVFSIGVEGATKSKLQVMTGYNTNRVFYVDNFSALETLYKNITEVLCSSTKPVCEKQQADLVFLLDQSSSIKPADYTIMKKFTTEIMKGFKISKNLVRVGLAQFSSTFKHEFFLNEFYNEENLTKHILGMDQMGGGTNIGLALDSIREYFQALRGSRKSQGISQNLVLITDGDSQDEVEDAAIRLKELGIEVFAIGIGDVHDLELLQITGTPERLFTVQNFGSLENIKQKVIDTICKSQPPSEQSSCTIDIAMGFDISQITSSSGEMLISSRSTLRTFLPEIVHYISSVPGLCCVNGPVKTSLGYRVVYGDGRILDDFRFEGYSEEVVNKVMSVNLREPTYFNTALLKSFEQKFKDQSRAGVKVLIIFSDGLDEGVMTLEHESDLLRQSGVSALLTVALEGAKDPTQLQMVEFGRGFGYKLPLSIGMPSVASTILKEIDTVSDRQCCNVMCKCSGHEGIRGLRGPPGTKGPPGLSGLPGFPGEEGVPGERGYPGPSGPQGVQGCSGLRGQKGYRGLRGNRGENGENGLDGVNGEQGVTGLDGAQGQRGDRGNRGIPGIQGEPGPKGDGGLRGDPGEPGVDNTTPGPKGEPGNPGLPGLPGEDGQSGRRGAIGNPGADGRRGPDGRKGAPGPPGDPGAAGTVGAMGKQGPRGVGGQPGPRGIPGLPGPQGGPGAPGGPGTAGRRGANGQKGQPGDPGDKGGPGSQGPRGMSGQDGRDGFGPAGPKGVKGDPGFPGYPGVLGESGQQGLKGYPGRKGNQGRGGNSGPTGEPGVPGEPGYPGRRGLRGPPGGKGMTDCQLITYIRDNCACSIDRSVCPSYPTELVFALDMGEDVNSSMFEKQRSALLSLLEDISIAESNCPSGARVAVVGYSGYTKYLIRFHDYRHKKQLIEAVKNIALERTSSQRDLGASMRFVAHNIFKRTRAGALMRRVAIFLSTGSTSDNQAVVTAAMEYQAFDIFLSVISLRNIPLISRALEIDDSGNSLFTVLGGNMAADLRKVKNCVVCYDPCKPTEECGFIKRPIPPQQADVDLVLVADSSREMQADEYAGVQQLLGSVVEHLSVSQRPKQVNSQARVCVVQQNGSAPVVEFGLQTYQNHDQMRSQIYKMQQRGGSSALGHTLDFTLKEVFRKATNARKRKALMAVVGTQTALADRAKLQYISQKAKCEGVAVFVVTVGNRYSRTQVEELASRPLQQHLIHVDELRSEEQGFAQRFFRGFLNVLNKGINTYPPPSSRQICEKLKEQEEIQILIDGQGQAQLDEEEVEESFLEQRGGQTHLGQLDIIKTATRGDVQTFISGFKSEARCQLDADAGIQCKDYVKVWFFDKHLGACSPLWYSGCGGNANRFKTENECLEKCASQNPDILPRPPLSSFVSKDSCFFKQDPGNCQNYTMMWFFDTEQNECSRFWYSGCGGNENRFKTQEDCENLCLTKSR